MSDAGAQILVKGSISATVQDTSGNPALAANGLKSINAVMAIDMIYAADGTVLSSTSCIGQGIGISLDLALNNAITRAFAFGNPNAIYKEGLIARSAVETARKDIAKILGARVKEIIFTNGGTESDNLAIF